ncbi:hypothetical protein BH09SUM1_BH09SUM1_08390 [soil metagenome]
MIQRRHNRGYTIICLLIVLVIIGILSGGFMGADTPGGKPFVLSTRDRARAAVTAMNTKTAQTQYFMTTEGQRPPLPKLQEIMAGYSQSMGGGGKFFLDQNETMQVTTALPDTRFGDKFPGPRIRL